ncbi:class I SAM-dependent methyltransferase [Pseudodesulfovibrio sp.]|uniref:class I SAM-dependent methyltransferase n=1 Tax=unclassified Pseudodesulfovibrio TaxID=2661612 RepID=UPI003B004D89
MPEIQLETTGCDLCGSTAAKPLFSMPDLRHKMYTPEYSVVQCRHCPHRYLSPRPTRETSHLAYPSKYYANRTVEDAKQLRRYEKQAALLPKQPGKLLDVGCAGGAWITYMQSLGWVCEGQDLYESPELNAATFCRVGYLPEMQYEPNSFDYVTAWGVMEHVHSPSSYFKAIHDVLKPGGTFLFMVPNGDSWWSRWAFYEDIPRHLHFFRKKAIRKYAEKYHFSVDEIYATNDIYSKPASGRGMFRRQTMRFLGVPWKEIDGWPNSFWLKVAATLSTKLDHCISADWEERHGLAGNLIVRLKKAL